MNISRLNIHKILSPLILLVLPFWASAQVVYIEVLVNDTAVYEFASCGNAGQIIQESSNGTHILNGEEGELYGNAGCDSDPNILEYIPDIDFIGFDTMKISYWELDPFPIPKSATLVFEVVAGYVKAVDDYVASSIDSVIVIDVASNDESNTDISLSNVPLVNHGQAEIVSDSEISFTPASGFEGIAHFNYTICDDSEEICDVGKVSVFVQSNVAANDTTTLVTLKNQPIAALMPTGNGYLELLAPSMGTLEILEGRLVYTPTEDSIGLDIFSYAYNTNTVTSIAAFKIDVLWAEDPNGFAIDDYTYTSIGSSNELNVLDNDLNDDISLQTYGQGENGTVEHVGQLGNGDLIYTPEDGFEGVDKYTYTAVISGTGTQEDATVYVVVSNQNPEHQDYDLVTPVNVPLILNYDIPITNYEFAITGNGDYGNVIFYPGDFSDHTDDNDDPILVNGQEVEGYNLVIYWPTEPDYAGWDQFEINYCVGTECQLVKVDLELIEIEEPQADTLCVGDCVWAGDSNYDGKANITDLLPIGYCVGEVGDERENGGVDWYGQYSNNWNGTIGNVPINIKHVDTDGDGYIGEADTVALSQFYGNYHDLTAEAYPPYVDIPLYFIPQTDDPGPGDLVITDIVLGVPEEPAIDIHGLTFALNFNEEIVEPGTMEVNFFEDNWLAYNSPMLSMVKQPWLGRVETGYTRANGISAHGYGVIGQVSFIVTEDIDGNRLKDKDIFKSTIRAEDPITMNSAGRYVSIRAQDFDLYITKPKKEDQDQLELFVYPNPSADVVNIHLNGNSEIEQLYVYSLTGKEVYRAEDIYEKHFQLETNVTSRLANGMYIISAITDQGVVTEKVEILR